MTDLRHVIVFPISSMVNAQFSLACFSCRKVTSIVYIGFALFIYTTFVIDTVLLSDASS